MPQGIHCYCKIVRLRRLLRKKPLYQQPCAAGAFFRALDVTLPLHLFSSAPGEQDRQAIAQVQVSVTDSVAPDSINCLRFPAFGYASFRSIALC